MWHTAWQIVLWHELEWQLLTLNVSWGEGHVVFTYRNMSPCDTRGTDTGREVGGWGTHDILTSWHPDFWHSAHVTGTENTRNMSQISPHSDTRPPGTTHSSHCFRKLLLSRNNEALLFSWRGELTHGSKMMPSRLVLAVLCVLPWCFDQIWFLFSVFLSPRQWR